MGTPREDNNHSNQRNVDTTMTSWPSHTVTSGGHQTHLRGWGATHLSLPVHPDDATGGLVDGSDKDGLPTDAVHVDARAGLQVVQVDVAKLGDQVDRIVLRADLEGVRIGSLYESMRSYTHACMDAHTHTCMHARAHTHTRTHSYTHTHARTHTRTYTCTHTPVTSCLPAWPQGSRSEPLEGRTHPLPSS